MKTSKRMQTMVTRLARKHGLDLVASEGCLELRLEGYMPLCIERRSPAEIAVYHYYIEGETKYMDPEVVFFTVCGEWVPIRYRQDNLGIRVVYAYVKTGGTDLEVYDLAMQADLATFTETWAHNLKAQGWLEYGEKRGDRNAGGLVRPDAGTLERWLLDSVCEAACEHGCIVEHDGHCPHGKPSWFLKLGLI